MVARTREYFPDAEVFSINYLQHIRGSVDALKILFRIEKCADEWKSHKKVSTMARSENSC